MIRKGIIVVLTFAASVTALFACISFVKRFTWSAGELADPPSVSVRLEDGFFHYRHLHHLEGERKAEELDVGTITDVFFVGFVYEMDAPLHGFQDRNGDFHLLRGVEFVNIWTPFWMPIIVFLLYPAVACRTAVLRRIIVGVLVIAAAYATVTLVGWTRMYHSWGIGVAVHSESIITGEGDSWSRTTPGWLGPIVLLVYPVIALIRAFPARRRRYRKEHGLCFHCGYDLTGNVSGVCPECGMKVEGA